MKLCINIFLIELNRKVDIYIKVFCLRFFKLKYKFKLLMIYFLIINLFSI